MAKLTNPILLNVFYLAMGILAARSEGNEYPFLTVILFLLIPNLLYQASSRITRKIIEKKNSNHGRDL